MTSGASGAATIEASGSTGTLTARQSLAQVGACMLALLRYVLTQSACSLAQHTPDLPAEHTPVLQRWQSPPHCTVGRRQHGACPLQALNAFLSCNGPQGLLCSACASQAQVLYNAAAYAQYGASSTAAIWGAGSPSASAPYKLTMQTVSPVSRCLQVPSGTLLRGL